VRRLEVDLRELRDEHQTTAGKEETVTKKQQDSLRAAAAQLFKLSREMFINVEPTRSQCKQIETIAAIVLNLANAE
jgi:hypothetical protein